MMRELELFSGEKWTDMIKRKRIVLIVAVLTSIMLTGATRIAPNLEQAPELNIRVQKIDYPKPLEPLTIFWAKDNEGLYKTIFGPDKTKTTMVMTGIYSNILYEDYETLYFLKHGVNQTSDIYKLEVSSKRLTRLTSLGGIDQFFLKNKSIYYITNSMTIESGVYRMALDGKSKIRVSSTLLDAQDKRYRYYIGSGIQTDGLDVYFPLMRQPLPSTGEKYIVQKDDEIEFNWKTPKNNEEQLSTYFFYMTDYMGDADSDSFVFVEHDEEADTIYLHLFKKGNEIVRKIIGWELEPLDILHGWAYFTAKAENLEAGGTFAIRLDGSGLRQVGNNEFLLSDYLGSIKRNLVFQNRNDGTFTIMKEL
ncbi:hypothetical protein NST99_17065 [Paenibacillus sp. FSL L8-0470]|uniref:hypothetical protein n=1 Tax=Paenibacillus sp. FSL L8-0470 TaxID=2954688 RepID=UPI0030F91F6A